MGFQEGPQVGTALEELLNAKLDGLVMTKTEEVKFIEKRLRT
jgi:hypothetical protein